MTFSNIEIPREIKELYPKEFACDVCDQLRVDADLHWKTVQQALVTAAYFYNEFKERRKNSSTEREARNLLAEFVKSSNKTLELWNKLQSDFYISFHMENITTDNDVINSLQGINSNDRETYFNLSESQKCLDLHKQICEQILSYEGKELSMPPQQPLEDWVLRMQRMFKKVNTSIKFSKGEYWNLDEGTFKRFESDCIRVLEQIMRVLDPEINQIKLANKVEAVCKKDFI